MLVQAQFVLVFLLSEQMKLFVNQVALISNTSILNIIIATTTLALSPNKRTVLLNYRLWGLRFMLLICNTRVLADLRKTLDWQRLDLYLIKSVSFTLTKWQRMRIILPSTTRKA